MLDTDLKHFLDVLMPQPAMLDTKLEHLSDALMPQPATVPAMVPAMVPVPSSAWEWDDSGDIKLHREDLHFDNVELKTRSYK